MNSLSKILLLFAFLPLALPAQVAIQVGGGTAVGWMIYHNGLSDDPEPQSLGYDRTYVSLLLPIEGEVSWTNGNLRLGLGISHTIMYDETMIGSTDRRGNRNRYRVSPPDKTLLFDAAWLSGSWQLPHEGKLALRPALRIGTFRSNITHPAWPTLGPRWLLVPGIDISYPLSQRLDLWVCPQYFHLWRNDSNLSRSKESLHLYSLDVRLGLRLWLGQHLPS